MNIKMLILILPSFFKFSIFHSVTPIKYIYGHFSVKDFSITTRLRIRKFGTKFNSDQLYCVAKTATYCISVPLFVHFCFPPKSLLYKTYGYFSSKFIQKLLDLGL